MGRPPPGFQRTAPGAFFRQGYDAGLTRFGPSSDGRSATLLLATAQAATTSIGYGYKWAQFSSFCGPDSCPLPASVETIGRYLGHLFRLGRVGGTSIRPYLAAIRTVHIRAGFPSPTDDPVITSLRAGYCRATADRLASRPRSLALPTELGLLALTRALHRRRPTFDAAIAVGFVLGLRPMSLAGLVSPDITISASCIYIRLRREKGHSGGYRPDHVLRVPYRHRTDPVFRLFRRLARIRSPVALFTYTSAAVTSGLRTLSRLGHISPPPLGRFTCRSLRSGCISAAHAIGVPLSRIMALSGHSSTQIVLRHYLDGSFPPSLAARELFGRFLAPASS